MVENVGDCWAQQIIAYTDRRSWFCPKKFFSSAHHCSTAGDRNAQTSGTSYIRTKSRIAQHKLYLYFTENRMLLVLSFSYTRLRARLFIETRFVINRGLVPPSKLSEMHARVSTLNTFSSVYFNHLTMLLFFKISTLYRV